ncbi:hypothetical protein HMPREF1125_0516 [Streptococcus oralis SK304]|uniref:Uncharacterized protein n=1 Tax=Streptococcus oralis SK304 TaxID=1161421 RepID=J4TF39_STROR|nr:hypothetical protein HMPREF1125_0516 [Streptococcus oralis SK304]
MSVSKQNKEIEDRMGKLLIRGLPVLFLKRSLVKNLIEEKRRWQKFI